MPACWRLSAATPASRAELAEVTHLTQPAVSGIVLELMEMGLVREAGLNRSDSGPRPRVRLEIAP